MYYDLTSDLVGLVKIYEIETESEKPNVNSFGEWLNDHIKKNQKHKFAEPEREGKSKGRSADSLINTSLVHLYRYAKLQAKTAVK